MKSIRLLFICIGFLLGNEVLIFAQSNYSIQRKIQLTGDGGWDYISVDESNSRIFVSHSNIVQAIDITTGKIDGTIPDTKGIHGIAIAPGYNKGFTSNGRDSSVTIFNLQTLETIIKVKITGKNPDAIVYDPFSRKVFTFNGGSATSSILDAINNTVIGTIPLEGKPEFAVTDDNGRIFVNIEDKNIITVINSTTLKVEKNWSLVPGDGPSGLAIDKVTHCLFSVCSNKLMVILNSKTGKIITTLPIGNRCDGVVFDPDLKRIYCSNGEGTITVVQEEDGYKFKVLETIPSQLGARTIAVNKTTHHLYLPTADYETANANTRPGIKPNTFVVLDISPLK